MYLSGDSAESDFNNVQMVSHGGRQLAYLVVDGKRTGMAATEVDCRWYVAVLEPKGEFACRARTEGLILKDLIEWCDHVTKGIHAGSVTSDNIAGILSLERMPPGMPRRQGMMEESYHTFTVTSRPACR
ncbi:MAG: hypothetical protein AMK72_08445 [Planctomycetes bacterium SM23_25]|nr:MAG: hypothetical protein AMK72_08445 [Planctomycetes bacterium SM23_25]